MRTEQRAQELDDALRLLEALVLPARKAKTAAEFVVTLGNLETAVKSVRRRGVRRWSV